MSTKLHPVAINKHDTCFSYALKRAFGGHPKWTPYWNFIQLSKHSEILNEQEFIEENVKMGDILLWDKNARVQNFPNKISATGEIELTAVDMNRHCVVVESINPIRVSECKLCSEEYNTPHILLKDIDQFKRLPDKILRLK